MSWNNGYERRKFEQVQKAQAKEYRKCGMNEEQIQAMYLQDLQEYRNNRIYAIHIQSIEEIESDGEESRNALHKKFLLSMTCTMDMSECGRYGWIDEIENNALYEAAQAIRGLNRADSVSVPIIAMTADAFAEDIQRCLECGMNAHIAKPIDVAELTRLLKKHSRKV